MTKIYSIKQVSELTGLSASNIRYYEKEGLIKNIDRNSVGIRLFGQHQVEWIKFLGRLKDMEMPIYQMKEYARLREIGDSTIRARMNLLERHKKAILEKITRLNNNLILLENKIDIYKKMEDNKNG